MKAHLDSGEEFFGNVPLNLVDVFVKTAEASRSHGRGIRFVHNNGSEQFRTYFEIMEEAKGLLSGLRRDGFQKGDTVIFQFKTEQYFVNLFWACVFGGMVPVPLTIVTSGTSESEALTKLLAVSRQLNQPRVFTELALEEVFSSIQQTHPLQVSYYESINPAVDEFLVLESPAPDDLAFIQFSSGSTGSPKGVRLTHKNLVCNTLQFGGRCRVTAEDYVANWMPLTHDMGIVAMHLTFVLHGCHQLIISPTQFIKNPTAFLEKVTERRATFLGAPNFALAWMEERVPEARLRDLNLSSVRIIVNGAEPISMDCNRRFLKKFSACQLKDSVIHCSYGMAEASVAVCVPDFLEKQRSYRVNRTVFAKTNSVVEVEEGNQDFIELVEVGSPMRGMEVEILDDQDNLLEENQVGNIVIKGPNVTSGYFNNPEANQSLFVGDFLRTGDLGFVRNGRLVVAGRKKDVIFFNGQNFYAHDVERVCQELDWIDDGKVVVCGLTNHKIGREELLVFVQYRKDIGEFSDLSGQIKKHVNIKIGNPVSHVIPVKNIPKTTSGKIQRFKLSQQYLDGDFDDVIASLEGPLGSIPATGQARDEVEKSLLRIWETVVGQRGLDVLTSYFVFGISSLELLKIAELIASELGASVEVSELFECQTIRRVGELIKDRQSPPPPVPSLPIEVGQPQESGEFPMTHLQMAYLLGRDPSYELGNISTHAYLEIETGLDIPRLNDALVRVVRSHGMLRAVFSETGQHILGQVPDYKIVVDDLTNLDSSESAQRMDQERSRMSHHVFRTDTWPLFEIKALRLSGGNHRLCFGFDMLIMDAGSLQIFIGDLLQCYNSPEAMDRPMGTSFRDYTAAIQRLNQTEVYQKDKAYWMEKRQNFPLSPRLPTLAGRTIDERPWFVRVQKLVDGKTWSKIKRAATEHGITPSALLCSVYLEVLAFWSNQPRLAINLTFVNRHPFHPDVNEIIGDFTSVIPLGVDLMSSKSFWETTQLVQRTILEGVDHRHYDGVEFVRELTNFNGGTRTLIPVIFTSLLANEALGSLAKLGEVTYGISQTSQVYLDFQVSEVAGCLATNWDYLSNVLERDMVEGMFDQFHRTLESIASGLSNLEMELAPGQASDLHDYNATSQKLGTGLLHELFSECASRFPDNTAVVDPSRKITYRDLEVKSNQVAQRLLSQGVASGSLVCVLAVRSIESIINILGVLKAGAAYVPIDPQYPQERIDYIVQHSQCDLLLGPDFCSEAALNSVSDARVPVPMSVQSPAYVIYTSGSTGRPKGVVIAHEAVVNTILDINHRFQVNQDDRILGISSMCFDLSVFDIFGALLAGATLVQVPDQRDVINLYRVVEDERITIWNSVPAIMDILVDSVGEGLPNESMRLVLLSGDWIPVSLPAKIRKRFSHPQLVSLGGATEASIWSIYFPIGDVHPLWKSIPYGMPLANQTYFVLDYKGRPCPPQVEGELFIGGIGVAQEYYRDKERTAEAMISHPQFGRLYKTGDFGTFRWSDSRELYIEFLGRKDSQVKINGHRIELAEIEKNLATYPGIENCVVLDRSDSNQKKFLCAYFVSSQELDPRKLEAHVAEVVPEYMVPRHFVKIDHVPLTPNGKVDRKALVQLDLDFDAVTEFVKPRSATEEHVHRICCEVLGTKEIGILDSLFEHQLDSIKTVTIIAKLEKELQTKIAFRDFVRRSTIEEIALLIQPKREETPREHYPSMNHDIEGAYGPFPTTEIQTAYILGRESQFEISGISAHFYGEIDGAFDVERLNHSVRSVIARHPMLRTVFDSSHTQRILERVPLYTVDVLLFPGSSESPQFIAERNRMSHQIFPIDRWPLFELKLAKFDQGPDRLMIGYDLLVADGASALILGNEIMECYKTGSISKAPLECTFRDYLLEYQNFKASEQYRVSRRFWMEKLADFPTAPQLPLKTNPSSVKEPHFARLRHPVQIADWERLKRLAQVRNVTPSAVLCTAYAKVLAEWGNQERLAINMTVFNRYPFHERINEMVGDFTSTVLVGLSLRPGIDFWDLAAATQETIMEALEHRHFDGVEFTREILKHSGYSSTAGMPIVFTSMLQGNSGPDGFSFGKFSYSVSQTPQVYIDYQVSETAEGLIVTWDYVEELFDGDMIGALFRDYAAMLDSLGQGNPAQSSGLLAWECQLIDRYNDTDEAIQPSLLHQLFVNQASRTGDNVAVIEGEHRLTYRELDERSNQVARRLVEVGVKRNQLVGVRAVRDKETIVNTLGILKAGGAYVPIDPQYPQDRVDYILSHSRCNQLLERDFYDQNRLDLYSGAAIDAPVGPQDIAYVIYTSGSTGKPKGVVITHEAAANTILDLNRKFQVNSTDRILGISSMCFDLSVYDIFGALASGAALVQVPDQRDVRNLFQVIQREGVTIWNSVPTIMDMMIQNTDGIVPTMNDGPVASIGNEPSVSIDYWTKDPKYFLSPNAHIDDVAPLLSNLSSGERLRALLPELMALARNGLRMEEIDQRFEQWPRTEVRSLVKLLMDHKILVSTITPPHEVFKSQERLFDNPYDEDIIYNAEAYEAFKKKQLLRTFPGARGEKTSLTKTYGFPSFIEGRRTHRRFHQQVQVPFASISQLLSSFMQRKEADHLQYYYPCAGGLYPIDVFVYVKEGRIENLGQGLYYYSPVDNSLTTVNNQTAITRESQYYTNREIFDSSAATLYFVYNAEATMPKYGGAGYLYACIDTGIMVGLMVSVAEMLGLGTCSIGEMDFENIRDLFALNRNQVLIHSVEIGMKEDASFEPTGLLNLRTAAFENDQNSPPTPVPPPPGRNESAWGPGAPLDTTSSHLRLVMLSGDWIPLGLPAKVKKHFPNAQVISLGGATEASIWSIYYPIKNEDDQWKSIPYGVPLANQTIHVLDQGGNPCHVGVAGELYIGGIGVAQCYYDDEEKTNQSFVVHSALGRLYRTGDYGRLQRDGLIEFLGRKDQQVKIKGHRIELGEIENCIAQFPGVISAAVVDFVDSGGKKYLCAYYVSDNKLDKNALKDHVLKALPSYMLPAFFSQISSIPLSSNAKVDKKLLPVPDLRVSSDDGKQQPRNDREKTVLGVWKSVLKTEDIGVSDNFFEVGGDSVLLVAVHTKLDQIFPGMLKITDLFTYTSVTAVTEYLQQKLTLTQVHLELPGTRLPAGYFLGSGTFADATTLNFALDEDLALKARQRAHLAGMGTIELLASLFLYVIGQISGENRASVQTMVRDRNTVTATTVDFSSLSRFDQLFEEARREDDKASYRLDLLPSLVIRRTAETFHPAFIKKSLCPSKANLVEYFDFVVAVEESEAEFVFSCDYNGSKLRPDMARSIVEDYVGLINAFLDEALESELEGIS